MWIREEPLSASALEACYPDRKGSGSRYQCCSTCVSVRPRASSAAVLPGMVCLQGSGLSEGRGEAVLRMAIPKEIRGEKIFVLILKQEIERSQTEKV